MKATLYKLKEGYVLCSDKKLNFNYNESMSFDDFLNVLSNNPDFSELKEEDVKRIGWFDVEKLAENEYLIHPNNDFLYGHSEDLQNAYKAGVWDGVKRNISLTADRRFTLEIEKLKRDLKHDLRESVSTINKQMFEGALWGLEKLIQSLSQPKSWEVTISEENGVYKVLSVI